MNKFILASWVMLIGMNSVSAAKLAEREELKRQLLTVDTGINDHYEERLYPYILAHSGKKVEPIGLVLQLQLAYAEYLEQITRGLNSELATSAKISAQMHLKSLTPEWIRAILPNDKAEAEQAILFLNQIQRQISASTSSRSGG